MVISELSEESESLFFRRLIVGEVAANKGLRTSLDGQVGVDKVLMPE